MNKVPFVIIGILLITAVFVAALSTNENNPLQALGDVTPTAPVKLDTNALSQGQPITPGQKAQNQQVAGQQTQAAPTVPQSDIISAKMATIHTAKGDIEIQLFPEDAPKTVQNFATLAKRGYYNGIPFHRVEDWLIQGGDPNGNGTGGYSIFGPTFEDELNSDTPSYKEGYVEGVVAMANRGPNTNGSQFFIVKIATPLPHSYTIFGKVTKGMDVVNKIVIGDKMTSIDIE